MAIAPTTLVGSSVSFIRDHALAISLAVGIGVVVAVAAITGEPWLVDHLFLVGALGSMAGFALYILQVVAADTFLVTIIGGSVMGLLPLVLPDEPIPTVPLPVEAGPSIVRSDPPVLIDAATGCEWIGTNWNRATPRIGPDGAIICNGKSTGKAPPSMP